MRSIALALALSASLLVSTAGCTYHAGIGGMGTISSDGKTGGRDVPQGAPSFQLGAGPCVRWPRLRLSLTGDAVVRVKALAALVATEAMWIFDEGYLRDDRDGTSRTSLALKGRLAGGRNSITDRWIAEAGLGFALVTDIDRRRRHAWSGESMLVGDFNAVSLDLITTYAPDRDGEGEVWLGAQLTYHTNGLFAPVVGGGTRIRGAGYGKTSPGYSTDCNSGHLP